MTNPVTTRPALLTDLKDIEAIEQACFGTTGDAFSRRVLAYLIDRAQGVCFAAVLNGKVVGYLAMLTRSTARNARIYSVAVDPTARGCGGGQGLVSAAIKYAQEKGLREVTLEVRADNTPAQKLYEKYGFRRTKILPGYYHDGSDGWRMALTLPSDRLK